MELNKYKGTPPCKRYEINITYCGNGSGIVICSANNDYKACFSCAEFLIYSKYGEFAYKMKDLTDRIPNVLEDTPSGGWLFAENVDLSNVVDELIGIYEHWLHLNSLMIEYLNKSSPIKSANSA